MTEGAAAKGAPVVAFLGPAGTFSQIAAERHFGAAADARPMPSIDEVFLAVESGVASYGVVPVENSTEGAVNYTQDCLIDTSLQIIGEVVIAIEHNFMLRDPASESQINRIVSHRQSLAQCRLWLKANWSGVPQIEASSNAEAARMAAEDDRTAAIAGEHAAERYGLKILYSGIQDRRNNSTRFLILAPESVAPTGRDRTSILVWTENKPGALFRVLEPFERHQVSLTKIETRPARDDMWAYVFFIDFEGHHQDAPVQRVLDELKHRSVKIKHLGSYPMAPVVTDTSNGMGSGPEALP